MSQMTTSCPFGAAGGGNACEKGDLVMSVSTILFVVLLMAWIGGFTVFHVAGGLIHLLLVLAVISLVLRFVMGKRTECKPTTIEAFRLNDRAILKMLEPFRVC